jgi:hypothetical protein
MICLPLEERKKNTKNNSSKWRAHGGTGQAEKQ